MEEQRRQILKELQMKHETSSKQAEEFEEKIKSNKKVLDQTRIGKKKTIQNIYFKVDLNRKIRQALNSIF